MADLWMGFLFCHRDCSLFKGIWKCRRFSAYVAVSVIIVCSASWLAVHLCLFFFSFFIAKQWEGKALADIVKSVFSSPLHTWNWFNFLKLCNHPLSFFPSTYYFWACESFSLKAEEKVSILNVREQNGGKIAGLAVSSLLSNYCFHCHGINLRGLPGS